MYAHVTLQKTAPIPYLSGESESGEGAGANERHQVLVDDNEVCKKQT